MYYVGQSLIIGAGVIQLILTDHHPRVAIYLLVMVFNHFALKCKSCLRQETGKVLQVVFAQAGFVFPGQPRITEWVGLEGT